MKRVGNVSVFLLLILLLPMKFILISSGQTLQAVKAPIIQLDMDTTEIVLDLGGEPDEERAKVEGNISIIKPEELRNRELHVDIISSKSSERISLLPKGPFILNSTTDELHLPFYVYFGTSIEYGLQSGIETYSLLAHYYYDDDHENWEEMLLSSGSVEIISFCKVDYGTSIVNQGPTYFNEWYPVTLTVANPSWDPVTATLEPINLPSNIRCKLSSYSCYIRGGETEDVIVKLTQTRGEPGYHEVEILIEARTWAHNDSIIATVHFESQNSFEHQIRSNIVKICFISILSMIILAVIVLSVLCLVRKKKR